MSNRRIVDFYEWTNAERTGRYTWRERMRKQNAVDFFRASAVRTQATGIAGRSPRGTEPVAGIDIGHFETKRARTEH